jgi:hypothetical protein
MEVFPAAHAHSYSLICILPPCMHVQYVLLPSHYLHAQPCGLVQDTSFFNCYMSLCKGVIGSYLI